MKKRFLSSLLGLALLAIPAMAATPQSYVLSPGDELQVTVFGHPDLSTSKPGGNTPLTIRPDGNLSFPLIGEVTTTGKTVNELNDELTLKLSEYVREPNVSINVVKLGTTRVYVLGEVNQPGLYELTKSHNAIDAIGMAKGFTKKSAKTKVFLVRKGATVAQELNINNFFLHADSSQNVVLNEGDMLYVTRNHKISITGDILPLAYYAHKF